MQVNKNMQGEAWGFDAEFINGPCDGYRTEVIAVDDQPPKIWKIELEDDGSIKEDNRGKKFLDIFLNRQPAKGTKVSVYELGGNKGEDFFFYNYLETIPFEKFSQKY